MLMLRSKPKLLSHGPEIPADLEALREAMSFASGGNALLSEAGVLAEVAGSEPKKSDARINLPNAISLSGYASTIYWLGGGHPGFAIYGLVADEADGRVARATKQTSEYGGLLDWAIDITLTGLVLSKLGWTWGLLLVTPAQAYLRQRGYRPTVGSARALFTVIALLKGWR